jgi:hypothetical protein
LEKQLNIYEKRSQTARAAEALVAAELTARGYKAAFLGTHHPIADFKVAAPSGKQFLVNAKGHAKPSDWAYGDFPIDYDELYYVLVELTPSPCFYILTQAQSKALGVKYQQEHPKNRNIHRGGFGRKDPHPYRDAWNALPS